jgi:cobalt-zinc-cadmium efflux system protein
MSAGHGHTPGHGHAPGHGFEHGFEHGHDSATTAAGPASAGGMHRWRLRTAFGLVAGFLVVELIAALTAGSLALLSDAGHMAADVVALGAALVATRIATRPDSTGRRTYGSYRAEVFASGLAVLLMLGVSVYIVAAAIGRIGGEPDVASGAMVVVGVIGLVVNVVALALLRGGAQESLNVKGAYLEVVADTVGSIGVIAAGTLVRTTGSAWWDTGIALAIAVFVAVRAIALGREVLSVLAQHAPPGLPPEQVAAALASVPGVKDVHDVHVWTLTSGMNVATAHLMTAEGADAHSVLDQARQIMRTRFGAEHATLQVEPDSHLGCQEVTW